MKQRRIRRCRLSGWGYYLGFSKHPHSSWANRYSDQLLTTHLFSIWKFWKAMDESNALIYDGYKIGFRYFFHSINVSFLWLLHSIWYTINLTIWHGVFRKEKNTWTSYGRRISARHEAKRQETQVLLEQSNKNRQASKRRDHQVHGITCELAPARKTPYSLSGRYRISQ